MHFLSVGPELGFRCVHKPYSHGVGSISGVPFCFCSLQNCSIAVLPLFWMSARSFVMRGLAERSAARNGYESLALVAGCVCKACAGKNGAAAKATSNEPVRLRMERIL